MIVEAFLLGSVGRQTGRRKKERQFGEFINGPECVAGDSAKGAHDGPFQNESGQRGNDRERDGQAGREEREGRAGDECRREEQARSHVLQEGLAEASFGSGVWRFVSCEDHGGPAENGNEEEGFDRAVLDDEIDGRGFEEYGEDKRECAEGSDAAIFHDFEAAVRRVGAPDPIGEVRKAIEMQRAGEEGESGRGRKRGEGRWGDRGGGGCNEQATRAQGQSHERKKGEAPRQFFRSGQARG